MLQENAAYGLPFPVMPVLYKYVAALLGRGTSPIVRPWPSREESSATFALPERADYQFVYYYFWYSVTGAF